MMVAAVGCIIAIVAGNVYFSGKQEQRFIQRLHQQEIHDFIFLTTDGDTLHIQPGEKALIYFWATWSDRSTQLLHDLYQWNDRNPEVPFFAAFVKDAADYAIEHDLPGVTPFKLVDGTDPYQQLRVPGIPSLILADEQGSPVLTHTGSTSIEAWLDSELLKEKVLP